MAEILCLICKKIVTFGDNCKCFFYGNNDQQYSLPRLEALDLNNEKHIEEEDENLSPSIRNYGEICSEYQQIQIEDYENVNLLRFENNAEARLGSGLNRIRKFGALTEETPIDGTFQNQFGHLIYSSNFMKKDFYSDVFSFKVSTKPVKADYKPEMKFCRNWDVKELSKPDFYQERRCEIDPFNSTDQTLSFQCETIRLKNNSSSSFSSGEKSTENSSGAASQETYWEINDFSTTSNFSVNKNFWPVSNKMVIEQSEGILAESLKFPQVDAQPIDESRSLIDNVSESIQSMKDAENVLGPFEVHSDCNLTQLSNYQKVTSCKEKMERHKRKQTFEKPFSCCICEKRFTRNSNLKVHYRIHTNERPFICDICKRAFRLKHILIRHYRIHTNEKPFVCDICGKGFCQKTGLLFHYPTHTGGKPYECDVCRKGFCQNSDLISHYRIHTDEKPYECDLCEKRFKHRGSLIADYRSHTGEKSYECDFCEKRFNNKSNLNSHYLTHTGEKPNECGIK